MEGKLQMKKKPGLFDPRKYAGRGGMFSNPMLLGVAAGAAILLAIKYRKELRPYLRSALREFYGFRDWLIESAEEAKSDVEDLVAEAKESLADQIARDLDSVEKERAILKRMEKFVKAEENSHA